MGFGNYFTSLSLFRLFCVIEFMISLLQNVTSGLEGEILAEFLMIPKKKDLFFEQNP